MASWFCADELDGLMPITKRPCANCPFRSDDAAIELRPGRVEGIVQDLIESDFRTFSCHKSLGGERMMCAGAVAVMAKLGRMPVIARLGLVTGVITQADVEASMALVIDPATLNIDMDQKPRKRTRGLDPLQAPRRRSAKSTAARGAAADERTKRRST